MPRRALQYRPSWARCEPMVSSPFKFFLQHRETQRAIVCCAAACRGGFTTAAARLWRSGNSGGICTLAWIFLFG
jgi:hypothetical protein